MSKDTEKKPMHWYVKWAASITLLIAMSVRASALSPLTDTILSFIGCAGWLYVSLAWEDRALIILNAVACTILLTGILTQIQNAVF
tara:strand:+ start:1160 stop:1417 length:258 start_codon:yes stop_codon:yes gene_type:complete